MKYVNFYLLLAIVLLGGNLRAQVTNSESFDGTTFVPTGWVNEYVSGTTTNTWSRVTSGTNPTQSPRSGAGEAMFASYSYSSSVRCIITPAFDLSGRGGNTPTVSFWMYRDNGYSTTADRIEVMINTSATQAGATSLGTINRSRSLSPTVGSDGWYQYTFNMPGGFNTGTNYIIFKATSAWGNNIYVDDVQWQAYPPACSGTPNPGNTLTTANPICPGTGATLSLQNATTGSGVTYQWQSSPNGTTWTNISGANAAAYTVPTPATGAYYRCNVTCSGNTGTSTSIQLTVNSFLSCYCQPQIGGTISTGCNDDDMITNVTISTLNNNSTCSPAQYAYINYSGLVAAPTLNLGTTYAVSVSTPGVYTDNIVGWIDFDQSGTFDASEFIAIGTASSSNATVGTNWALSTTGKTGTTRMRIKLQFNSTQTSTSSCATYTYGECEDYDVNLVCPSNISFTTNPVNTSVNCGNNTTMTAATSIGTGFTATYKWQVSTNGGGLWTDISNGGVYSNATTATLNITGATLAMNSYQYRCVAQNDCGTTINSTAGILTVNNPAPVITAHPSNTSTCNLSNASFSVTATNAASYIWQMSTNGGGLWSNVANGGIYSGAFTATLTLTGVTTASTGYMYRCSTMTACNAAATSNAATLTVNSAPSVTTNPTNKIVCPSASTNFSCAVSGAAPFAYQWQLSTNGGTTWNNLSNGGIYSNVTTATMNISSTTSGMDGYQYRCVINGLCNPPATTTAATLNIYQVPSVTSQPVDFTYCAGGNATFSCTGTGAGVTYQWMVSTNGGVSYNNIANGGVYSGATTSILSITAAPSSMDNYRYRCVINGTCTPSAFSNQATLTLGAAPAITVQPNSTTACTGAVGSISLSATGYNITYQWQESINGGITWNNVINGGVYGGATSNTITFTNPSLVMNGFRYRCIVTNGCTITTTSNAVILTVANAPIVTSQPINSTICEGSNTQYSVAATSSAPVAYQWQGSINGTTWSNLINASYYSGVTTTTLQLSNVNSGAYSMYRCVLNTGCIPATTSNTATLTVQTQPIITLNPTSATICETQNIGFQVGATGSNLTYQWQVSTNGGVSYSNLANGGVYSGSTTFNLTLTNPPVTFTNYRYRCVVSGSCPTVKTSNAATLTINTRTVIDTHPAATLTLCSGDNTSLSVAVTGTNVSYRWYIQTGSTYTALNNGGFYSGVTNATLNITGITAAPNTQTYTYRCIATGTCNAVTSNAAVITVNAKPAITASPVNVTRCDSTSNVSFNVTATGTNISYQWQLSTNGGASWANLTNNSTYQATTTSTLLLPNAYFYMNGYRFRCVVSGTCAPAATSGSATLTVNPLVLPIVTISANNTDICAGQSVIFSSSQVNGGAATYQWKKNNVNVGTGTTYTTTTLADNDIVICHMTSNATCPSPKVVVSNPITMKVTQYSTPTIAITSNVGTSWCTGKPIEFNATITNGGANPTYIWKLNNVVIGANSSSLALPFINNGDKVVCSLVSSLKCFTPNPAVSNTITMTVNLTTTSSIVIAANPDSVICDKTEVTMFAFFTNGGPSPSFQWMQNGMDIPGETGGTLKTTGIANGDFINCRFISSATCVFPEISNPVTFNVGDILDPKVNVAVSYNGDNSYTFTAIPVNGGANPAYQWYRNFNKLAGETGATYTTSILDKTDRVYVEMASSEPCVNPLLELIQSRIATTGVGELGAAFKDLGLYPNPNTGQFTISGELNQPIANKEVVVKITNALGQTVYTQVFPASGNTISQPITLRETVANGMYIVNITIDNETTNIRFVLSR